MTKGYVDLLVCESMHVFQRGPHFIQVGSSPCEGTRILVTAWQFRCKMLVFNLPSRSIADWCNMSVALARNLAHSSITIWRQTRHLQVACIYKTHLFQFLTTEWRWHLPRHVLAPTIFPFKSLTDFRPQKKRNSRNNTNIY